MSPWLQNLIVLLAVAACLALMIRQAVSTFRAGKGGFGSCCAKGCSTGSESQKNKQSSPNPAPERIVFLPADMLKRRK